VQFVVFNTSEKLSNNLVNAWMATEAMSLIPFGDKVLSFLIQKLSLSCLLLSSHLGCIFILLLLYFY
jgi:hypothetical protein